MSSALKPYSLKLFLSNKYTYAQIVRKADGHIVAAASTIEKSLRQDLSSTSDKVASTKVGDFLAKRALEKGVEGVEWKRKQGQRYHGKIAALLTQMTTSGLQLV
ncbi:50S ribosomal protein L18 [Picochlorum sp. SENEW3]|nr:50S ribosomal protein L18 [Picochlorum sp. SENEW3]